MSTDRRKRRPVAWWRRLLRHLRISDSILTEVLRTALKMVAYRGLVGPGGAKLAARRRAFAAPLDELPELLEDIREMAASDGEIVLGAHRPS